MPLAPGQPPVKNSLRGRLAGRLQLPLTLVITLAGAFVFLFQRYDLDAIRFTASHTLFIFFVVAALIALGLATLDIGRAWLANEYRFMPYASQTAEYRQQLLDTYAPYPESDAVVAHHMRAYIQREYVNASSFNAGVNDRRSNLIDVANQRIVLAATMLMVGFFAFQLGGLDESRIKKPQEVTVTKPIEVKVR